MIDKIMSFYQIHVRLNAYEQQERVAIGSVLFCQSSLLSGHSWLMKWINILFIYHLVKGHDKSILKQT